MKYNYVIGKVGNMGIMGLLNFGTKSSSKINYNAVLL